MKFILTIVICLIFQINAEQEHCYAETTSPYSSFSWLTSYFSSRRSEINVPKNCSTIYVWAIIRHGTRYPSNYQNYIPKLVKSLTKMRDKTIENHAKGRGSLCKKDLDNLQKWSINLTEDMALELTPQGKKEMNFLAQKVKQGFPNFFDTPSKNLFMNSDTNRTRDCALAFSNELMGTNFTTARGNNITQDDEFLQLYKHCPNYAKQVKLPSLYNEIEAFKSSALWQKITAEISLRLGFLQPLSYASIHSMHTICAYEKAWYINSKPPFCAAFTTEDLKVKEYLRDMDLYYTKGYGNPHPNENMGCPIVQDMLSSLLNASRNVENIRGKFLFSHSEAIVPLTVKLGLNKDKEPLTLENFNKFVDKREWKSAHFDSFGANVIVALHKCPSRNGSQNVVTFHQNEYPVVIPQCASDPCTLEELQNIFQDVFDEKSCNTDFCQVSQISKSYSIFLNSNIIMASIGFLFIKFIDTN